MSDDSGIHVYTRTGSLDSHHAAVHVLGIIVTFVEHAVLVMSSVYVFVL